MHSATVRLTLSSLSIIIDAQRMDSIKMPIINKYINNDIAGKCKSFWPILNIGLNCLKSHNDYIETYKYMVQFQSQCILKEAIFEQNDGFSCFGCCCCCCYLSFFFFFLSFFRSPSICCCCRLATCNWYVIDIVHVCRTLYIVHRFILFKISVCKPSNACQSNVFKEFTCQNDM